MGAAGTGCDVVLAEVITTAILARIGVHADIIAAQAQVPVLGGGRAAGSICGVLDHA